MKSAAPVIDAIAALFRDKIAAGCEGAGSLESALQLLDQASRVAAPEPSVLPALRYWDEAIGLVVEAAPARLTTALREAAPVFHWRQNPNYLKTLDQDYLSGYAFTEFVGEVAPLAQDGLRVGLLLIGPDRHYPEHNHPAEEIYLPLTSASWWRAGEDWREVPPGQVIHHAPWRVHATKTGKAPLIALYAWLGEVARNAELTVA